MEYRMKTGELFEIRSARHEEWDAAMELAFRVFLKYEAPEYGREGTDEFARFLTDTRLQNLFEQDLYKLIVALKDEKIIGVASMRSGNHISLLFVDDRYHKQGIGSSLLSELITYLKQNTSYRKITVHSSPYGREFYHSLGFVDVSGEMTDSGIIYTPMELFI